MARVLAILHKTCPEFNSITRINVPICKTANVITMLKWLNILRSGSLTIARDALHDFRALLIEIGDMIAGDNEMAAHAFKQLGVRTKFCEVALPNVSTSFDELNFTGEHDGMTFSRKHKRSQKQFLDIYGALSDPSAELSNKVLHKTAVLVLKTMTTVTYK